MPKQDANGDLLLVAAHAWDIQGAARANLKTAFITKSEHEYLSIYPQLNIIADDLVAAANKMINFFA
jgi:2-haloacid dehalogenase